MGAYTTFRGLIFMAGAMTVNLPWIFAALNDVDASSPLTELEDAILHEDLQNIGSSMHDLTKCPFEDSDPRSCVLEAVKTLHADLAIEVVAQLLTGKYESSLDDAGNTILHAVVEHGRLDLLNLFLDRFPEQTDVDAFNKSGISALMAAVSRNDLEMSQRLVRHHASPILCGKIGSGATLAVENGYVDLLRSFLRQGMEADSLACNQEDSLLTYAVRFQQEDIVSLLIRHSASFNRRTISGYTALHKASCTTPAIAKLLIEAGADVEEVSAGGDTALHLASGTCADSDLAPLMLRSPTEKLDSWSIDAHRSSIRDEELQHLRRTSKAQQSRMDKRGIISLLIDNGANTEKRNSGGKTALLMAATCNDRLSMQTLIRNGADCSVVTAMGNTIAHLAVYFKNKNMLQLISELCEKDALNPGNTQDSPQKHSSMFTRENSAGESPLSFALRRNNLDLVGIMMEAGADPIVHIDTSGSSERVRSISVFRKSHSGPKHAADMET